MNEQNLDYLNRQLKYTGFGEELQDKLKQAVNTQQPEITLHHHQSFGKDNVVATLHLRKPEESDMYFFNRYQLTLKPHGNDETVKQTFYINPKEDNVTLKEAYNLLSGRAVHKELTNKEGEKYQAWLQLDFKTVDKNGQFETKKFHQNYGYDLEAVVHKLPLRELADDTGTQRLMESLRRGNVQAVTLEAPGKDIKLFIEASPQFKSLNMYDSNMKRIQNQTVQEQLQPAEKESQSASKQMRKAAADDEGAPEVTKSRKRSQKIS